MLKKPLPGRARTALGLGFVAALVMGGSYAAWAAQPGQVSVENANVPAAERIHADVVLSVDGAPLDALWNSHSKGGYFMRRDAKNAPSIWELGLITGHPFSLEIQRSDETWHVDGTVRPTADHTYELESTLRHNGSVVSRPKLITRSGEPAVIKIGEDKDGKFKGLGAQFTFRDATPPIAEAKRIQIRSDGVADVSYRRMTRIEYPQSAIDSNGQGVVYIGVRIGVDGKVADAKVNSVMPVARTDLADAALAAVKTWTFEPRIVDGNAVASDTTVSVAFSLDPKKPLTVEPGVLDAIRVSPPLADSEPTVNLPFSENVEFRRMHPPRYPASALKAHEQGEVVLKVHVDAEGYPIEAAVEKTDPPGLSQALGNAAIASAMQWQLNPTGKDGKSVAGWVYVPVNFSLTRPK